MIPHIKDLMSEELGLTAKKEDFSNWYSQVIQKADLADFTSVSGCIVFKPYSYAIWEKIQDAVDRELKRMGVQNVYFPMFIPEKLLNMEKRHVEGFTPEVAWVTEAGKTRLNERIAVRPTSETIMYESYAKWIRSWRDLPLRYNQWNSVVRWEFKHPIPFFRTREFLWNEGHSAFATKNEAEKEVREILDMYTCILKDCLALPGLPGKKTELEKFAGAEYTTTIELILPNGRGIQGPDSHHLGQNFAKVFNIRFVDRDEKEKLVWQNSWAITTRMIGVLVAIHGDDSGLVLPPRVAPLQIVIIPIIFKKEQKKVMAECNKIKMMLNQYSVLIDKRDYSPGWKFNEWELKGVPLRIEVGPRDVKQRRVVVFRRHDKSRTEIKMSELEKKVPLIMYEIHKMMLKKAKDFFNRSIARIKTMKEMSEAIESKKIVLAPWCSGAECEKSIKEKLEGVKSLNIPFRQPKKKREKCVVCGKKAELFCYFGRSY